MPNSARMLLPLLYYARMLRLLGGKSVHSLRCDWLTFKVPRQVVFVDEIPKGATGKVQRIGLAATLGADRRPIKHGLQCEQITAALARR